MAAAAIQASFLPQMRAAADLSCVSQNVEHANCARLIVADWLWLCQGCASNRTGDKQHGEGPH